MGHRPAVRLLLAATLLTLAILIPGSSGQVLATTAGLEMTPTADAWLNKSKPNQNNGSATVLRAQKGAAQTLVRFRVEPWRGMQVAKLELVLSGIQASGGQLRAERTDGGWQENSVTWNTRPSTIRKAGAANVSGNVVRLDVTSLFAAGTIELNVLNLRVKDTTGQLVRFGSRESADKPRLVLTPATQAAADGLAPVADTFANQAKPNKNFGASKFLRVTSATKRQSYLKFDLSAWNGRTISSVELHLTLVDGGGRGVNLFRVGNSWQERTLTWNSRPTGGTLLNTINTNVSPGLVKVDLSSAFPDKVVNLNTLSLRLATPTNRFVFSSREGTAAPQLVITAAGSSTINPSPSPSPTPEPVFHFRGGGNAHGVGMSQYGAYGRAVDKQPYADILAHYYDGTSLGTQSTDRPIRVLLASGHTPTASEPARVEARKSNSAAAGSWHSATFPELVFPASSYADMSQDVEGTWNVKVYGQAGALLAIAQADDFVMQPTDPGTLFYMKFRDSLRKYDLYRGQMRLRVNASGVQAVNILGMDDYVRGVVPGEMPASWPARALRAQAVAARSYATFKLRTTNVWDVKPDKSFQLYGGVNIEHAATNDAVVVTAGRIVLRPNGNVAETLYHAVAGGHTEHNEYAFVSSSGEVWVNPVNYLRGKPDVDGKGVPYEIKHSPNLGAFSWKTANFTMSQLSAILAKDSRTDVGPISSISFKRGVSGRAYQVTLTGSKGTKQVAGGVFANIYNTHKLSGGNLRSMLYYLEPTN